MPPARLSTRARACSASASRRPAIQAAAEDGDADAFALPVAMANDSASLDFSFSGLKTALAYLVRDLGADQVAERRADLAAAYQEAVVGS